MSPEYPRDAGHELAARAISGLYLVTADEGAGRDHVALAAAAILGGVRVVQFRDKGRRSEWLPAARAVRALCRATDTTFVVNDDADVAMALEADGLHLGQSDLSGLERWQPTWPAMLGVSASTAAEARAAVALGAHYVGVGPVFATATKPDAEPPMGLASLAAICKELPVPVAAIGGIGRTNVADVMRAGASAACVISAVTQAPDPQGAARELTERIDAAFAARNREDVHAWG